MTSSPIDARRSIFYYVGRDHYNVCHVNVAGPTTEQIHPLVLRDLDDISCRPASSSVVVAMPHSKTGAAGNIAAKLMVEIVQLLINHGENEDDYRILELELESLRQTMRLTHLAMQAYEHTPLSRNLASSIVPEVEQICTVLQKLFDRISNHHQGPDSTSIRDMWSQVWRSGCEADGLASLRTKLQRHQKALGEFLVALNSVQWTDLGNGIRAGRVSLRDFRAYLRNGPLSLRHILVNQILVVDHLGRNIPVPTMFCSTWKDFDYIINGYCRDRFGNRFVERGDYEILRADDSRMINRSEFANAVEPGMVFEMSIVMRRSETVRDNKEKCPRCLHINSNATVTGGWIECCKCSGKFQIAEADKGLDDSRTGEVIDDDEEIMSPAFRSQSRAKDTVYTFNDQGRPQADDGTQFFRRIHVICAGDGRICEDTKRADINISGLPDTLVYVRGRRWSNKFVSACAAERCEALCV